MTSYWKAPRCRRCGLLIHLYDEAWMFTCHAQSYGMWQHSRCVAPPWPAPISNNNQHNEGNQP